jgi:segregation and condensation protein A
VEVWDLVSAFGRLLRETTALQPTSIVVDETPVHVYMERIMARLRDMGRASLGQLCEPPRTKARLIGILLAILELMRGRQIGLDQPEPFGELWVELPET